MSDAFNDGCDSGYDERFMLEALKEAEKALSLNEIPIGCIIEQNGVIIGRGHNRTETDQDTTAHAEMVAIRQASKYLGETLGWRRLTGCRMYVTMEPCCMCAGALVWSRIEKLYIGVRDPKAGGCGSVLNVAQDERLNHRVEIFEIGEGDVKMRCGQIVKDFFKNLRELKKQIKAVKNLDGSSNEEGTCKWIKKREVKQQL